MFWFSWPCFVLFFCWTTVDGNFVSCFNLPNLLLCRACTSSLHSVCPPALRTMALFSADAPALLEHSSLACAFTPFDVKWLPCTPSLVISGSHARGTGALVCATLAPGGLDKKAEVRCMRWLRAAYGDVPWFADCALWLGHNTRTRLSFARRVHVPLCSPLQFERPAALKCSTFGASDAEAQHLAVGDYAGRLQILYVW
ncbi:hypothetical protein EON66_12155 [archaeon]|nr:MAG: hypothetical protein EON66_12155 [archaeon]